MKYLVLGAGMMGHAIAYDLATTDPQCEVLLTDIDEEAARRVARAIGSNVFPARLDVHDGRALESTMTGCDAVVSAVSYSVNLAVSQAAIRAGVHLCDLGGNNDVVDRQRTLHAEAAARGVTVVPNCGLAPGLINILAVTGSGECEELDAIHLRVGGLPQQPRPPLDYQIVFSVEGLLNEYLEPSTVIHDGCRTQVESLTGVEDIRFPEPFGTLEAFSTSGGLSILPELFTGKVRTLDYKTIRYRGHSARFKMLLDLGFASAEPIVVGDSVRTTRELFTEMLKRCLAGDSPDVVLARAEIVGRTQGRIRRISYEFIDFHDTATGLSAMMRTTGFPTAIVAQMLASGVIRDRGVLPPEVCVPGQLMIAALARRGITIRKDINDQQGT